MLDEIWKASDLRNNHKWRKLISSCSEERTWKCNTKPRIKARTWWQIKDHWALTQPDPYKATREKEGVASQQDDLCLSSFQPPSPLSSSLPPSLCMYICIYAYMYVSLGYLYLYTYLRDKAVFYVFWALIISLYCGQIQIPKVWVIPLQKDSHETRTSMSIYTQRMTESHSTWVPVLFFT